MVKENKVKHTNKLPRWQCRLITPGTRVEIIGGPLHLMALLARGLKRPHVQSIRMSEWAHPLSLQSLHCTGRMILINVVAETFMYYGFLPTMLTNMLGCEETDAFATDFPHARFRLFLEP
ncbi:hypothetical protein VNO77_07439 [Canavalia gladiata]|uniref:Uncharacterized protein n=1 Tax=Canavalia gladiata TaxID=3824 RepID=A0AAN9MEC0_CANGL